MCSVLEFDKTKTQKRCLSEMDMFEDLKTGFDKITKTIDLNSAVNSSLFRQDQLTFYSLEEELKKFPLKVDRSYLKVRSRSFDLTLSTSQTK